jgi:hypothetical protein
MSSVVVLRLIVTYMRSSVTTIQPALQQIGVALEVRTRYVPDYVTVQDARQEVNTSTAVKQTVVRGLVAMEFALRGVCSIVIVQVQKHQFVIKMVDAKQANHTTAVAKTVLALVDRFVIPVQDIVIHHHQEGETIQKGGMMVQIVIYLGGGHVIQTIIPNL